MKITKYYIFLFLLLSLITGFLVQNNADTMSMPEMVSVSIFLGIYVVGLSLAGEGKAIDERDLHHRYSANRIAYLAGVFSLSCGVLINLFNHTVDYWLLTALIAMNAVKIATLIYCHYKK